MVFFFISDPLHVSDREPTGPNDDVDQVMIMSIKNDKSHITRLKQFFRFSL